MTQARLRVAFLSFEYGEYSMRLASALNQMAEVQLLLPQGLAQPYLHLLDGAVHYHPFRKPRLRQPLRQLQMVRRLCQTIHAFKPDVVHLQQGHFWMNLALPWLRRYPLIITIHDPRYHVGDKDSQRTPQVITDFGFRQAVKTIVHNHSMKDLVVAVVGLPADQIAVIPHVALGDLPPSTETEESLQVLFFGRIWAYKGLDYLIRAEPLITQAVPGAKIVIAGEGEDFTTYRQMMRNPENYIVYNEFIPATRVAQLFQQASVVALPYIEATQSGVIPLAYTFGKPVVATRVGGLPEAVDDGRTGYLVPPRDEQALADAIVKLLRDSALRHEFGLNARHKAETEFCADPIARKTYRVYEEALRDFQAVGRQPRKQVDPVMAGRTKGSYQR